MAKKVHIRVLPSGLLYYDFSYNGIRCKEYTNRTDTPENRKRMEREAKERLKREKVREAKRKKYAHEKDEPLWKFIWKELMG